MSLEYFNKYEIYYEALKDTTLISDARNLSSCCDEMVCQIKTGYFDAIINSEWDEQGKRIFAYNIVGGLDNQLNTINNLINYELCASCELIINVLFPKLEFIRYENIKLNELNNELAQERKLYYELKDMLQSVPQNIKVKSSNFLFIPIYEEEFNPQYVELETRLKVTGVRIDDLIEKISVTETLLIKLCKEADAIIQMLKESDSKVSVMFEQGFYNEGITYLTGEELRIFKENNNIPLSAEIVVSYRTITINGISFNSYYVYDTTSTREKIAFFEQFVEKSLENVKLIDDDVLRLVETLQPTIIFKQDESCEGMFRNDDNFTASGYFGYHKDANGVISDVKIVLLNLGEEHRFEENALDIIHEFGHAFDFGLTQKFDEENAYSFSSLNKKNTVLFDTLFPSYTGVLPWETLVDEELNSVVKAIDGFSNYSASDLKENPSEYMAECFQEYFSSPESRENLRLCAPKTYETLDKLINEFCTILVRY